MSSDSELSQDLPSDGAIEEALQRIVRKAYDAGKLEDLTVNSVRNEAEQSLGLEPGFLKSEGKWKARSKEVINKAVESPGSIQFAPKPKPASQSRKVEAKDKPIDRQKEAPKEKSPEKAQHPVKRDSSSSLSDVGNSDDSLSDVKDDGPPKKKKKTEKPAPRSQKPSKAKPAKPAKESDLSPDEQEIKRLQGWLIKCGIRKLWHRELAGCDSNKAKISHLKTMLENVGMTGRYSVEKASAIKEQRELAADLEAVQEGNKQWGMSSASEEGSDSDQKPQRRARGVASRFVDFGSDDDDDDDE